MCVCVHRPGESLRLIHNQCLSSQGVIAITQQVAMETSLIGSRTESTINRCPWRKGGRGRSSSVSLQRSRGGVVPAPALAKAGAAGAGTQIRL